VNVTAYILAKNEEANISNCLQGLKNCGLRALVLDSGSTDQTRELAIQRAAEVEPYEYRNHLEALRYLCQERTPGEEFVLVLDADMVISPELLNEAKSLLIEGRADVAVAPVTMYWGGRKLDRGSLCPAKPFMFRGGAHYFEAAGHGEALARCTRVVVTSNQLIHNDLKPFEAYLASQLRYSDNLARRRSLRNLSWRDRLRTTPLMMLAVPAFSYFFRGGVFSGKASLGYAMDRLIAEAIMYRQHIAFSHPRADDSAKTNRSKSFHSDPE
jgi:glycosyltransferase involved in cell wall biosynthesis